MLYVPIPHFPYREGALTQVAPFTYREGETYTKLLERLQWFMVRDLLPWLSDSQEELYNMVVDDINKAIDQVNEKLETQTAEVNASIEENREFTLTEIASLTQYVNDKIQEVIDNSVEVQDPLTAQLIESDSTLTRLALDSRYVTKHELQTALNNINESVSSLSGDVSTMSAEVVELSEAVDSYSESIEYLNTRVSEVNGLTDNHIKLYVSASRGSDDTGDGSESKPFKTITKLFKSIPKNINRDRLCYIDQGVYDEEPALHGIVGSAVHLYPWGNVVSAAQDTGIFIRSLRFYDCLSYIFIQNFTFMDSVNTQATQQVLFSRCAYGTVNACRFALDTKARELPNIKFDGSGGGVNSTYFSSGHTNIWSLNGSRIRVDSTNQHVGTPSTTNLRAESAVAHLNGSNAWIAKMDTLKGGEIRLNSEPFSQHGFSFARGENTRHMSIALKTPIKLSAIESVQLTFIGARNYSDGAPTSPKSFNVNFSSQQNVSTTNASEPNDLLIRMSAESGATYGDSYYFGVAWCVTGKL